MQIVESPAVDRILLALRKNDKLPIKRIAAETHMSVQTCSKYCLILAAQNRVKIENYGNMKLVSKK